MADFTLGGLSSGLSASAVENLNRLLSLGAVLVLLPLCFYSLSDVFWKLYYPDRIATDFDVATPQADESAAVRSRASWDWFIAREAPKPKAAPSKINARLLGVFSVGQEGVAIISLDKGKPQSFHVGDEIKDGVVVDKLAQSHVVLLRGEREEILAMKKVNLFEAKQEEGAIIGAGAGGISREYVRRMIREQPLQLAQMIRFEPTDTPRYGLGMRISARRSENESMLFNMGVIPGDILLKANGKSMDHLWKNPDSWRPLLAGKTIRLELLRNGALQNVTIDLSR